MSSSASTSTKSQEEDVDESLYSRQLYVFGHEAQRKMQTSSVLLLGLRGPGVEIAKNIILSGVKRVTLYDDGPTEWKDLSAQFFLSPSDVGRPRAAACAAKLNALNPRCNVSVASDVSPTVMRRHQVVVCTDQTLKRLIEINAFCRTQTPPIKFIAADVAGVFCRVFCDFGDKFVVRDKDDNPPQIGHVALVTRQRPNGVVTTLEGALHGLSDGDYVTFDEIEGMTELNDSTPRPIKVLSPSSFAIEDTSRYTADHTGGGFFRQVKRPVEISFRSLLDALETPGEFMLSDFGKLDRSAVMHAAWQALDVFRSSSGGSFPSNASDAKEVVRLTIESNRGDLEEVRPSLSFVSCIILI